MKLNTPKAILIVPILFLFSLNSIAQNLNWDEYDVIDGPNPTLRYGFYTESNGVVNMGRFYFIDDGLELRVRLAPYGKTAIDLPVLEFNRGEGIIELGWEEKPNCSCKLIKQNEFLFLGNCIEGNTVMPMAIRIANENDKEWMGLYFSVSDTDISILKKAKEIILSKDSRNLNGDRNCDDDSETGNFSFYCSLYWASIEVDGVYRHRRPAMQAVRREMVKRFPGDYVHKIRDINNNPQITNQELMDILDSVINDLAIELIKND